MELRLLITMSKILLNEILYKLANKVQNRCVSLYK